MSEPMNETQGIVMRESCALRALRMVAGVVFLAGFLAGCEGVVTGTEIARVPLQAADGSVGSASGSYAPVKFSLSPEMNPVAVNFRADFTQHPAEYGKWNTYRATLTKDGVVIAARSFNVNHPAASGTDSSPPPPNSALHTLFYVDVQSAGEYELTITSTTPAAVTLNNAQADARRNVQRPPQ
jgi:hypothetical protein